MRTTQRTYRVTTTVDGESAETYKVPARYPAEALLQAVEIRRARINDPYAVIDAGISRKP